MNGAREAVQLTKTAQQQARAYWARNGFAQRQKGGSCKGESHHMVNMTSRILSHLRDKYSEYLWGWEYAPRWSTGCFGPSRLKRSSARSPPTNPSSTLWPLLDFIPNSYPLSVLQAFYNYIISESAIWTTFLARP